MGRTLHASRPATRKDGTPCVLIGPESRHQILRTDAETFDKAQERRQRRLEAKAENLRRSSAGTYKGK